ncbi:MAG: FHA domain-containing protein [Myxococcales bacterium]|nr:FHA domain-containing protein [Myxococcales bacterium]
MTIDLNKKTLRHFYCRDAMWQCFERMSEDFDRGIDDLINEAMRYFAREKGYLASPNDPPGLPTPPPRLPSVPPAPPQRRPNLPTPPPAQSRAPVTPPPPPAARSTDVPAPPLYLIFDNRKYLVDKEQFIIGRGAKSSDLPIRDGNISRKHAAVIRRSGAYYIKDLGSTNGIDFEGNRVDNRRIEEGDVYYLCDYELKFTYK